MKVHAHAALSRAKALIQKTMVMSRRINLVAILLCSVSLLSAQSEECACCSAEYRQFDFWIGEWNVYRPDGTLAGTNHIRAVQDSCVLQENWVSATRPYTGTSYNYFDKEDQMWNQLWIDNQGAHLILKGHRSGHEMIMYSDTLYSVKGIPYIDRVIWTRNEDGTVRQLWERSAESGSWKIVFDGLYRIKKGE